MWIKQRKKKQFFGWNDRKNKLLQKEVNMNPFYEKNKTKIDAWEGFKTCLRLRAVRIVKWIKISLKTNNILNSFDIIIKKCS